MVLWRGVTQRIFAAFSPVGCLRRPAARVTCLRYGSGECTESTARRWTLSVGSFISVRVRLSCAVSVSPLDVHSCPEADRVFITLRGAEPGVEPGLQVHYDSEHSELRVVGQELSNQALVELLTPIVSGVYISTSGQGHVNVRSMECDTCEVVTERGDCVLHSLKCHTVQIQSGGSVKGTGTIHGNVDIRTSGHSMVDIKKLQGTRMSVGTEHGSLKVKAIYAEQSLLSSRSGHIQLGTVHGDVTVQTESGGVLVDGSNGRLTVSCRQGDIDAYVGQHGTADLQTEHGSISVRVPQQMKASLHLSGTSVEISPEVPLHEAQQHHIKTHSTLTAQLNGEAEQQQSVTARAGNGAVSLQTQSWIESLKIGS